MNSGKSNRFGKYVSIRQELSKPLFLLVASLFLFALGFVMLFIDSQSENYLPAPAEVIAYSKPAGSDQNDLSSGSTTLRYTVDGVEYVIDTNYISGAKIGDMIDNFRYDPDNPNNYAVGSSSAFLPYIFLAAGAVVFLFTILGFVKSIKKIQKRSKQDKAIENGTFVPEDSYDDGYEPDTNVKYYVSPDKGGFKSGSFMEDENRVKVCEALVLNFSMFKPFDVEFVNHLTGSRKTHKIGHTVTVGSGGLTDSSYFSYDGNNVWDYLHDRGIRIDTSLTKGVLGLVYSVTRCGKPYATVTGCGPKVHEEDAGNSKLNKLAFKGYYRVECYSTDIDLLFLTIFAITRTEQNYCN